MLLVGGASAAAVVLGVLWWGDRSLREAETALEQGEPEYALYLVTEYLEKRPERSRVLALEARALVALRRPAEAIPLFERAGAASAEDLHAWAQAELMQEQWSRALPLLGRVLELEPRNADVLYEITACRLRLGIFDQALSSAERLAELPGHEARGHLFLGANHRDRKNHERAADSFARVLEFAPDAKGLQITPDEFFFEYGQVFLSLGRPKEALGPLERSISLRPSADAYALLGNAKAQLGRPAEAVPDWKKAVETDPSNREAREGLASAALQERDAKKALEWLSPLASRPDLRSSTAYLLQRGHTMLEQEDAVVWQEKAAALRKREKLDLAINTMLRDSPQSFWASVIRAYRFASDGNWPQAEIIVTALRKQAPREPFVVELADAISRRGALPPLEHLPVRQF